MDPQPHGWTFLPGIELPGICQSSTQGCYTTPVPAEKKKKIARKEDILKSLPWPNSNSINYNPPFNIPPEVSAGEYILPCVPCEAGAGRAHHKATNGCYGCCTQPGCPLGIGEALAPWKMGNAWQREGDEAMENQQQSGCYKSSC